MKTNKLLLLIASMAVFVTTVNAQIIKPQFKGGKSALNVYIEESIRNLSEGIVINVDDAEVKVRFLVEKTGKVSSVTAIKGTFREQNEKAVHIVKNMPDWFPGSEDGVHTAMYDTLIINFLSDLMVIASNRDESEYHIVETLPKKPCGGQVFVSVEDMPKFPGGNKEMLKFISENLKYPVVAAENGIQGRVVLKFVVEKDGSVSNVKVVRSLDPSCNREAMRVVKSMPKWNPGKQNGIDVCCEYTLPITFKLPKEANENK